MKYRESPKSATKPKPTSARGRLAICGRCTHVSASGICGLCGCAVQKKCKKPSESCPIGKW
jgi:hypothetical protein